MLLSQPKSITSWEAGETLQLPVWPRNIRGTPWHLDITRWGMPGAETLRDSAALIELLKETRLWSWRRHVSKVEFHACPQSPNVCGWSEHDSEWNSWQSGMIFTLNFSECLYHNPASVLVMTSNASKALFSHLEVAEGLGGSCCVNATRQKAVNKNQGCWKVGGKQQVDK